MACVGEEREVVWSGGGVRFLALDILYFWLLYPCGLGGAFFPFFFCVLLGSSSLASRRQKPKVRYSIIILRRRITSWRSTPRAARCREERERLAGVKVVRDDTLPVGRVI